MGVLRIGAVAAHFGREGKVVVGKDTRRSCYMLEMALASGLCALGVDVMLTGPLPTPGVAHLARAIAKGGHQRALAALAAAARAARRRARVDREELR